MKVLHYSDKNSPNFLSLYQECDLLITTGDLTIFDFAGLETLSDKKPAFGIYGNHDSQGYLENLQIENVHKKVVEWNSLLIGGFQGCIRYKQGDFQYTEQESEVWAKEFPYVDILLLHAGPFGLLDDPTDQVHIGSKAILNYIEEKKPKFVFVGHQYSDNFLEYKDTKLFRTYGARIIEI